MVNSIEREYNDACPAVNLTRLTRFINCSVKETWLRNSLETIDIDFPTTPSLGGMQHASIHLIVKYRSTMYEKAFNLIHRLITAKHALKFLLGKRGADKALRLSANVLERCFHHIESLSARKDI